MRLGRGAVLSDTRNQLCDQERSQQSIAQNRQPRLTPGVNERSQLKTYTVLSQQWKKMMWSWSQQPLDRLLTKRYPKQGCRKGSHFRLSRRMMENMTLRPSWPLQWPHGATFGFKISKIKGLCCHPVGGAKKWFRSIPAGSVSSWQQLSTSFLQHFHDQKDRYPFGTPQKCETKEGWDSEILHQLFQRHVKLRNLVTGCWNPSSPHK